MTSAINPNNINGAYPVAGQDNNSQGFRDNFTNTKTNFQYAKEEISDLQSKVVLKAALTGETLNNNMGGSQLSNAVLVGMGQKVNGILTTTGPINLDYSLGSFVTIGPSTGPITLTFSLPPESTAGTEYGWTVQINITNPAHTLTLNPLPTPPASSKFKGVNGIQGYNPTTQTITFAAAGTYTFTFTTTDLLSTIVVSQSNVSLQPFNASFETLTANGVASLANTVTSFSTTTETVATLSSGVPGQIKILCGGNVDSGRNGVATVFNAGWKASGTGNVRLQLRGQSATLMFIGGKWFCVGNNGATFE